MVHLSRRLHVLFQSMLHPFLQMFMPFQSLLKSISATIYDDSVQAEPILTATVYRPLIFSVYTTDHNK
jgi:hypothetical protein